MQPMERGPYGVLESNPLSEAQKAAQRTAEVDVDWTDERLKKITRLRLLSDPGYPDWDVSYCFGELKDGSAARVHLPFSQLPKKNMIGALLQYAKQDKVYLKGLGVFDAISKLV